MSRQQPEDVRPATRADLDALAPIEAAADRQFVPLLGETGWGPPSSGAWRYGTPGFLLVAGDPPVGFAHVLELPGEGAEPAVLAHLEQLAVRPRDQRRGTGTALVRAAMARARADGHPRLSLCTFARVPWNAPFYRRLGFVPIERPTGALAAVRQRERDLGLDRLGERLVMVVDLGADRAGAGPRRSELAHDACRRGACDDAGHDQHPP